MATDGPDIDEKRPGVYSSHCIVRVAETTELFVDVWKVDRASGVRVGAGGSVEVRRGVVRGERRRHRSAFAEPGPRDNLSNVCLLVHADVVGRDLELYAYR